MNTNRRQSIRISGGRVTCKVVLNGSSSFGEVVDESIHGVCVGGLQLLILLEDQPIEVYLEGENLIGRCRSISRDADRLFRIGILKEEDSFEPTNRILLNSYMEFNGCKIVCLPIRPVDEEKIVVRLLDGKEFVVSKSKLVQLTKEERLAELMDSRENFQNICEIYSLLLHGSLFGSVSSILEQEFGACEQSLSTV